MGTEGLRLVDTSAWVWALRGKFLESIKARIEQLLILDLAATTPMIMLEILGGAKEEKHFADLRARLEALHLLPADRKCWERADRLAFELKDGGLKVPATDTLIAAVALTHDVPLLHADHHFDVIAESVGLRVESHLAEVPQG